MVNQIDLVVAITKELKRQGHDQANARQLNSVIEAANLIVRNYDQPHVTAKVNQGLQDWLRSDDTGSSSLFMAHILAGGPTHPYAYPHDPSDFGRCYRFLRAVPVPTRLDIEHMKGCNGKTWAGLVEVWPELEALYEKESQTGKCRKLYDRMQEIIKASREAF